MTDSLVLDLSPFCPQPPSCWSTLAAAGPPWIGAVLKATEGRTSYPGWFDPHWRALGATSLLRGCYTFLHLHEPGAPQADVLALTIEKAGGWGVNDLHPWIDVEWARVNDRATRAEVEDCVSSFVDRFGLLTGRACTLYAGAWVASLGVTSRMGCRWLVYPSYTATLDRHVYERMGWTVEELLAWQVVGLSRGGVLAANPNVPSTTPIGDADISVLTLPGGVERLREMLWAERPG